MTLDSTRDTKLPWRSEMDRWEKADAKRLRRIRKHLSKAWTETFALSDNASCKEVQDKIEESMVALNSASYDYTLWYFEKEAREDG